MINVTFHAKMSGKRMWDGLEGQELWVRELNKKVIAVTQLFCCSDSEKKAQRLTGTSTLRAKMEPNVFNIEPLLENLHAYYCRYRKSTQPGIGSNRLWFPICHIYSQSFCMRGNQNRWLPNPLSLKHCNDSKLPWKRRVLVWVLKIPMLFRRRACSG